MTYSTKSQLRGVISSFFTNLPKKTKAAYDKTVINLTLQQPEVVAAKTILGYMPLKDEITLTPLLEKLLQVGKSIVLPKVRQNNPDLGLYQINDLQKDLLPGSMQILEPKPSLPEIKAESLELILVPGRAFSQNGNRLGRGGGYYDRLFAQTSAFKLALTYEEQIKNNIPINHLDLPVDKIITPDRIINCRAL